MTKEEIISKLTKSKYYISYSWYLYPWTVSQYYAFNVNCPFLFLQELIPIDNIIIIDILVGTKQSCVELFFIEDFKNIEI